MLAASWRKAKQDENNAKDQRIEIEQKLIEKIGVKQEGTTRHATNLFSIATEGKLSRKVDPNSITAVLDKIGGTLFKRVFKTDYKVSVSGLRELKEQHPSAYREVCKVITEKPAKTAVSIKDL